MHVTTIGLDLTKTIFRVHGITSEGNVAFTCLEGVFPHLRTNCVLEFPGDAPLKIIHVAPHRQIIGQVRACHLGTF